jgi:phosphoglycolate phosphatase-like HAD superfamily hydrolase
MAKLKRRHWKDQLSVDRFFWRLPQVLSGKLRVGTTAERRCYNAYWSAITLSLFTELHHAFEIKSAGGRDDNGDYWVDLAPEYKAYKREKVGKLHGKTLLTQNQRRKYLADTPGLLSITQYKKWRKTFAKVYQREVRKSRKSNGLTDLEAKAKAASIAWAEAKKTGAETLIGTLGKKPFPILRITDTLFKSLKPGRVSALRYNKGDRNQVSRLKQGVLEIGTRVPYADYASRKITRTIGKSDISYSFEREFLPKDLGVFFDRAVTKGRDALAEEIAKLANENNKLSGTA